MKYHLYSLELLSRFSSISHSFTKISGYIGCRQAKSRNANLEEIELYIVVQREKMEVLEHKKSTTSFIDALKSRDEEAVKHLLSKNRHISADQLDSHKVMHCLFHDVIEGNLEQQASIIHIMKLFLDLGVNVNSKNKNGHTVLHLAVKNRMTRVVDFLISHGANLNVTDACGDSLIHFLIKQVWQSMEVESIYVIRSMLLKGVNVDGQNGDGQTALHYALIQRKELLAKLMLEFSKNVDARDKNGNTALNIVTEYYPVNFRLFAKKDEDMVRALLSRGANIHKLNENGVSPLLRAVTNRSLNLLKIFVERGANFFHCYGDGNLLHYFFKSTTGTDASTHEAVFNLLVSQGCDVNGKDAEGMTPLHFAVRRAEAKSVENLVAAGANLNCREFKNGYTPLHEAVERSHDDVVAVLLDKGADANARTKKGQTALHLVGSGFWNSLTDLTRDSNRCIIRKLIHHGGHIDVADDEGYLPLHSAIRRRNSDVMKELLRHGADINDDTHVLNDEDYDSAFGNLSEHIIKLRLAGLPVDHRLIEFFVRSTNFAQIHAYCTSEIACLKSYMITKHKSLYNFLHMNINSACPYVKNEKLRELVRSFKQHFPMYRELISAAYYKALRRRELLEPAKNAWVELTNIRLPDLCIYEIFSYLSNVDLRRFTDIEVITVI